MLQAAFREEDKEVSKQQIEWCGIPVIVDDSTNGLFEMPPPDEDTEQKPAFLVTQSTVDLVEQDFERYKPSLERTVEEWQEKKERFMQEKKANDQNQTDEV
jgi:hypothetical protein